MSINKLDIPRLRVLLIIAISIFYLWTVTRGTFSFGFHDKTENIMFLRFHLLGEAFLKGQLNLPIEVPSGLLNLPDQYDPIANKDIRWKGYHDLSFYKDKLYMYYGPTPALVLYIPFHLLTMKTLKMTDRFAVFAFCVGTLIWVTLLLSFLKKKYFSELPEWMLLVAIGVCGLGNIIPFLLKIGHTYQVAISCGYFFLIGAVYLFCRSLDSLKPKLWMLALGSLFLGLSIGGRIFLIFPSVVLIIFLLVYIYKSNDFGSKDISFRFVTTLSLTIPFLFCLALVFLYNYFRFDSIFENGLHYQLTSMHCKLIYFEGLILNLYHYLFKPPVINSTFPFIHAGYWQSPVCVFECVEPIYGLITCVPFTLILFFSPFYYLFKREAVFKNSVNVYFPKLEFWIIFLPCAVNFLLLNLYQYVTSRFHGDYMTLLILACSLLWFYFNAKLANNLQNQRFMQIYFLLFSLISIICGIAFSLI